MTDPLKKGRIVLSQARPTTGMGCLCSGPVYGTPYCACTLAYMAGQGDDEDEDYDEDDEE